MPHPILWCTFVLLHLVSWPAIIGLPQGAPETVCDTMLPFHGGGILPERSLPPFRIEPSSPYIGQGQTLRVDIVGVPPGLQFGGFMIHARNRNPPYQIIGQFNPTFDGRVKLLNCENSVNNSATHTAPAPKTDISLEWQSPIDFLGEIAFNATVAQSYGSFWVGIPSQPVEVVKREAAPPFIPSSLPPISIAPTPAYVPRPTTAPATRAPPDPMYLNCGVSKNCFGFPNGCLNDKSCQALATVIVRGETYEFEMRSGYKNPAYVALGLSYDDKMGDDLITDCVPENGRVNMYSSYTSGNPNYGVTRNGVPQNTARLVEGSFIDGVIYCKVQRDIETTVQGNSFNLLKQKFHLLLATGSSLKENSVGYHDIGRLPSSSPIYLAEVQNIAGAGLLLVRLHGAFMVAAWIGTTSLGIIFARYFKQTWVGKQTCGKDQWFVWHRICMVTTWSLTMAAFVLIFVELGAWSAERNPHAILGLITTILCFIQPIAALFRPAPSSKRRPLFNWAHWLGGNLAHILAIVTIFFAVKLAKAQLPDWMDWILVAYVVFHVVVHLIYSVAGCMADRQQTQRVNTFQMGDMGGHHGMRNGMKMERRLDAPFGGFRKGLLVVYIVILLLFVVALILLIALAPIESTFRDMQTKLSN